MAEKRDITKEDVKKLQEILVQACIDFINENNIGDIEGVSFDADMLQESAKYGSWQPCTDSSLNAWGFEVDEKGYSIRKLLN